MNLTGLRHFSLIVYKMDYAGLSNLNIKTLRGYLVSYNIPTQGMLEKQGLSHQPFLLKDDLVESVQGTWTHLVHPFTPYRLDQGYSELQTHSWSIWGLLPPTPPRNAGKIVVVVRWFDESWSIGITLRIFTGIIFKWWLVVGSGQVLFKTL